MGGKSVQFSGHLIFYEKNFFSEKKNSVLLFVFNLDTEGSEEDSDARFEFYYFL